MWKQISVLSLIVTGIAGLSQAPALAATAIAMDNQGAVYRTSHLSLNQARARALGYCVSQGGRGCAVIMTNVRSGFGAVAHSGSRVGTSTGYSTQAKANRVALYNCVLNTPANDSCRVTLQFFDPWR